MHLGGSTLLKIIIYGIFFLGGGSSQFLVFPPKKTGLQEALDDVDVTFDDE